MKAKACSRCILWTRKARASKVTSWRDSTHMAACGRSKLDFLTQELSQPLQRAVFSIMVIDIPQPGFPYLQFKSWEHCPLPAWYSWMRLKHLLSTPLTDPSDLHWHHRQELKAPWHLLHPMITSCPHRQAARQTTASQGVKAVGPSSAAYRTTA